MTTQAGDALAYVQAASVRATFSAPGAIADADPSVRPGRRSAFIAGFSLHADVAMHENDRDGLERLCRYGLRPAFAEALKSLCHFWPSGSPGFIAGVAAKGGAKLLPRTAN
jgi:hypothetical protein